MQGTLFKGFLKRTPFISIFSKPNRGFLNRLEVRQGHQGNHVPGLTEHAVTCADEAWELLQSGSGNRSVGATNANEHSSRSHW